MSLKIPKIDAANPDPQVLQEAARLVNKGEVLVCPTDTGYAFAADGLSNKAIARVFHLKGRSFNNPMHVAVSDIGEAEKYAYVSEAALALARHYLPGALTLVLPKRDNVPAMLVGGRSTVGIRVPNNKAILELARLAGKPVTTTSANISGKPTPYSADEVVSQLGEGIKEVAMVLDQGALRVRELSTIVDLSVSPAQLIRQGLVSWIEVRQILREYELPDSPEGAGDEGEGQ